MNRRLLNIFKNLFITLFQKFDSIIAGLAKKYEYKKMELQPIPIVVENKYSK